MPTSTRGLSPDSWWFRRNPAPQHFPHLVNPQQYDVILHFTFHQLQQQLSMSEIAFFFQNLLCPGPFSPLRFRQVKHLIPRLFQRIKSSPLHELTTDASVESLCLGHLRWALLLLTFRPSNGFPCIFNRMMTFLFILHRLSIYPPYQPPRSHSSYWTSDSSKASDEAQPPPVHQLSTEWTLGLRTRIFERHLASNKYSIHWGIYCHNLINIRTFQYETFPSSSPLF